MKTGKRTLETNTNKSIWWEVTKSNLLLLKDGWCSLWGIIGFVYSILWLWRNFI